MTQLLIPTYNACPSEVKMTDKLCYLFLHYFLFAEYMMHVHAAMANCSDKLEEK